MARKISVFAALNNREAVEQLVSKPYNLIVIDQFFPDLGGLDFCRFLRLTAGPMAVAPIVFGIHNPNQQNVLEARDAGVTKIAVMPFSGASLIKALQDALADTRDIVQHTSYNGPDRRTRNVPPPNRIERRKKAAKMIPRALQRKILDNL